MFFFWDSGVVTGPVIHPHPDTLDLAGVEGGSDTDPQLVTVTGGPFTGLDVTAIDDDALGWLHVGILGDTITVYAVLAGLLPGTYFGSFTIIADGCTPVIVTVTLVVSAAVVVPAPVQAPGGSGGRIRKPARVLRYEEMLRRRARELEKAAIEATAAMARQAAEKHRYRTVRSMAALAEGIRDQEREQEDEDDVDLILLLCKIL